METFDTLIFEAFAKWAKELSGVEEIILVKPKQLYEIWVITDRFDKATRYKIYDLELEMCEQFPDATFDFHLLDRRGRKLEDLITLDRITNTVRKIDLSKL